MSGGAVATQGSSSLDFQLANMDDNERKDLITPLCFVGRRHDQEKQLVEDMPPWRLKERMKTVSVALVLCLNVGVDPPDATKSSPCARLECWTDPFAATPARSLEVIGNNLQRQYERWQPRARYKAVLDPTVEEVRRVVNNMRRSAKDERVLFHYNGHGVPKPTRNGEVWVFNKAYTQYIPLSLYDLQSWTGSPACYVWECNAAGIVVEEFHRFQQVREDDRMKCSAMGMSMSAPVLVHNAIHLAACGAEEMLPVDKDMPADLFTACLTTPIKTSLRWWFYRGKTKMMVPGITPDMLDKLPGRIPDRRTPLGEMNWIFTAIADTIAWDILPIDMFQDLFRHDLLVASLFRNFLLAEVIMTSYGCTPISRPAMPSARHHPMWQVWEMVMDACIRQLPAILKNDASYETNSFFSEQLQSFSVWLRVKNLNRAPPQQLPIILQVLLSPVHRFQALELLGCYLDLGPTAVHTALSVGIHPYVLKLLQSTATDLRPLLVFVWTKILAVDSSCQADLARDGYYKYFLNILTEPNVPGNHRARSQEFQAMSAFILSRIVRNYPPGQEVCLQSNLIAACLDLLDSKHTQLRQWVVICLGCTWEGFDNARWVGVRDSAHEKLFPLLADPNPEIRAAVVFALGTFLNSNPSQRSDQSNQIDQLIGNRLTSLVLDGSHLVREELCLVFRTLVSTFESQFVSAMLDDTQRMMQYYSLSSGSSQQPALQPPIMPLAVSMSQPSAHKRFGRSASTGTALAISATGAFPSSIGSAGSSGSAGSAIATAECPGDPDTNTKRANDWVILSRGPDEEVEEVVERASSLGTSQPTLGGVPLTQLNKSNDNITPQLAPRPAAFRQTALMTPATSCVAGVSSGVGNPNSRTSSPSTVPLPHHHSQPWTEHPASTGSSPPLHPHVKSQFQNMWRALNLLASDPHLNVEMMAERIVQRLKLTASQSRSNSLSLPTSPRSHRQRAGRISSAGAITAAGITASPSDGPLTMKHGSIPRLNSMPGGGGASSDGEAPSSHDEKSATLPPTFSSKHVAGLQSRMVEDYYGDLPGDIVDTVNQFKTHFVDWLASSYILASQEWASENDADGQKYLNRHWRFKRNVDIRTECKAQLKDAANTKYRLEDQVFVNRNPEPPQSLLFHPYKNELLVADKTSVNIWDWETGILMNTVDNHRHANSTLGASSSNKTRITTMDLVNPHDLSMLMVGTDDGCVRLWRDYDVEGRGSQVAAWRALTDLMPIQKSSQSAAPSLVLDWEQESGVLFASGNSRIIRIWDTQREQIIQDIPTGADTCVTSLTSDIAGRSLLIAGCGDGSIRLYDRRLTQTNCLVRLLREHTAYVVKVYLQPGASQGKIISSSVGGDVRYWDPRFQDSTAKIKTGMRISCMDVHHTAPLLAVGSRDQVAKIYHIDSQEGLGTIKWHDGFMGQRISSVNSLAFHPYKICMAAGFSDSLISIYADEKKKL